MTAPSPIAVAIDFSDESTAALAHATELARRFDRDLVLAHALPVPVPPVREGLDPRWHTLASDQREAAHGALDRLADQLRDRGLRVSCELVDGSAGVALSEAAERVGADLLCLGTHGRTGMRRFLLGSVAERTTRLAPTDVFVARRPLPHEDGYTRILVPTDFSHTAELALARAMTVAARGASVQLLHCWDVPVLFPHGELSVAALSDELRDETRYDVLERGNQLTARYRNADVDLTFTEVQSRPAHGIHERLEEGQYDLVVIGGSGHGRLHRWLLGSVAESTVRHAPCSVWLVRS